MLTFYLLRGGLFSILARFRRAKLYKLDSYVLLGYAYGASGRDRRGRTHRTPPDPRGSNGKEAILGAAGKPARRIFYLPHEHYSPHL